ncbi:MAG: NIPSNAP family protein [Acidobacteriaceae bacterium]
MPTLCIRYKLDAHKLADFEKYARNWPATIERCGGTLLGYFLPTKLAGPTDFGLALIDFPDLAAYEQYRDRLMQDPDAKANVAQADASGCILVEDRSFLERARS